MILIKNFTFVFYIILPITSVLRTFIIINFSYHIRDKNSARQVAADSGRKINNWQPKPSDHRLKLPHYWHLKGDGDCATNNPRENRQQWATWKSLKPVPYPAWMKSGMINRNSWSGRSGDENEVIPQTSFKQETWKNGNILRVIIEFYLLTKFLYLKIQKFFQKKYIKNIKKIN